MHRNSEEDVALGLPDQLDGLPTSPVDRGDETQDRFRYQWAVGVYLLVQALRGNSAVSAIWCEHHDDFLVELSTGKFWAVQVKTDSSENANWLVTDAAFVHAISRFCSIEQQHGPRIDQYHFFSNAGVYIPDRSAKKLKTLMSSPMRLREACIQANAPSEVANPYQTAFDRLAKAAQVPAAVLFGVMRRVMFRRGPPLRGYEDTMIAKVIPALPDCASLHNKKLVQVCDELMGLVETASGIPTGGLDGVFAYIEANGRPDVSLRGKCITLESARTCIENARQSAFRYINVGGGLPLGNVKGQRDVLHRKMRNAYIEGQFESIWSRAMSAESRLLARAISDAENFDEIANQLEGAVLTECKDAEALACIESDERKRGPLIYRTILERLGEVAKNEPDKVENEPKDTLLGVAAMLSGSCRFAWGVPLDDDDDGAVDGA
ncbi:hypothetical protein AYM40_35070 [Paraburkholderia phytofirmans OLGA172]|uniref:CD-NTase associated protein 4-like DNA endonuclease domain-containing protein n=1 Tax=Paraburkholderia phytofirmans OLGA172 TaxID=1417228 RepID=A0A160FWH5_9BURK|nr:dsDNA nuclease domain-containing protein [Paraburkholderia phytofirmans]ANB77308.1 hypothetical protein AYM40_35070 [Paraburkholderia phytofirmans OLGA172]